MFDRGNKIVGTSIVTHKKAYSSILTLTDIWIIGEIEYAAIIADDQKIPLQVNTQNEITYYEKPSKKLIQHISIEKRCNFIQLIDIHGTITTITEFTELQQVEANQALHQSP
jgi:hypothetical protein